MRSIGKTLSVIGVLLFAVGSTAAEYGEYLVKLRSGYRAESLNKQMRPIGQAKKLSLPRWLQVKINDSFSGDVVRELRRLEGVEYVQPNYPVKIPALPIDQALRARWQKQPHKTLLASPFQDNPEIPQVPQQGRGDDPLFSQQWGMIDIGVKQAWQHTRGSQDVVVAVLDTGVDYTHEDLLPNLWHNPNEIAGNGVDDDGNGFVDDIVGWDFAKNDNKPYDLSFTELSDIFNGGNPGHGTHCAGNIAAVGNNAKGIAGVAPNVKIMAVRFLSEKGEGTTADAVEAINYAVANGAKVLSNSWGSEGEDPNEQAENKALREAIQHGQGQGSLFIFAAGNGHQGQGYDNDTDAKPGYPASYDIDGIVSVAAVDSGNKLGSFSNWGHRSVDLGAPGVKIFSTVPGNQYKDVVVDFFGRKITWDGTSMATPHVAGAAALYWSKYPSKTWKEVKQALLDSASPISALNGKTVSGGKLNVQALLNQ